MQNSPLFTVVTQLPTDEANAQNGGYLESSADNAW
jgi:hypothetical protein